MSQAEKRALALRDLAVIVAKLKGKLTAPDLYSYQDARIRIEYCSGKMRILTSLPRL
jgi:hypothetical protein